MRCATACWKPSVSIRARNYSTHRKLRTCATATFSISINCRNRCGRTTDRLKDYSLLLDIAYDELENLRLALEWGLERHVEAVLRLASNFNFISSWVGNVIEGLDLTQFSPGAL